LTKENVSYTIKERSDTDVTVQVTVEAQAVKNGIEEVYRRYGREARIPGFRKGRVPRAFLDSRFGREMFLDEAQKTLEEEHLPRAVSTLELHPVTPPTVNKISFNEGEAFVFEASFAVFPEFELPGYRGLELVKKQRPKVTEADVQAALEEVRHQYATLAPKQGETVNAGDIVHVKEGKDEWDARAETENPVTAKLIGRKVGETVEITLDRAGGDRVHAALSIVGLKEVILPEIDDELAKDAGYESLVALQEDIGGKLEEAGAEKQERAEKMELLDRLVDQLALSLPDALVDKLSEEELQRVKESFEHPRSPLSFEDYLEKQGKTEEEIRRGYRELVARRLRRELVLQKLAEAESIVIDDVELDKIASAQAEKQGENPLRFIARLKAEERFEDYRSEKVHDRILDLLHETAKFTKEEGCEDKSPSS